MELRFVSFALVSTLVLGCNGLPEPATTPDPGPTTDEPSPDEAGPPAPSATSQARADGLDLTIKARVPEGLASEPVPFTAEPLNLTVSSLPDAIDEADVLGTGLSIDLDGDGAADDTLEVACTDGSLTLGGTQLTPLAPEDSTRMVFGEAVTRLGEQGAWALQYDRCDADHPVTIGISQERIDLFHAEGPAVAVTMMDPPGREAAAFQEVLLDGEPVSTRVWTSRQATIEGSGLRWTNLSGFLVPFPADGEQHTIKVGVQASDPLWPRVVLVETRWAPSEDVRARTERAVVQTKP